MDLLTIVGMLVGIFTIILGQFLEGGHLITLFNVPALIIVFGGTCGAVMIETPWKIFVRSLVMSTWIFLSPQTNTDIHIKKLITWSTLAKRKGILGLESVLADEADEFTRIGLILLIDKGDTKTLRNVLDVELEHRLNNELDAARVFESMGGYAPTIGIIGAVIGLIQVMGNLTEPSKLGMGIAVAFVATVYGVGFANLFFLPVANKLKKIVFKHIKVYEMIKEGLVSIAEGENIQVLELKLLGFTK